MTTSINQDVRPPAERRVQPLFIAAVASLSAGAIHAAAIGAHSDHPAAVKVFLAVALFQMGWGAVALARRGKAVALVGAVGNGVLVGGWVLAKWKGLSFVSGLDAAEPIQFADGLCAALAAVSAVAAAGVFFGIRAPRRQPLVASGAVVVLALVALPGMVAAGNHKHSGGTKTIIRVNGKTKTVSAAVVPPHAYDPNKPIDLSGVKGVSAAEQARAENLISETVLRLPKWKSSKYAEAHGFKSIHDGLTGVEHFINYKYVADKTILDPDHPESLVYRVDRATQSRTLVSAMYMLPPGATLDTVPDIGGPLTQWHIHDNLCFTGGTSPHVAGLTDANGNCPPPLVKLQEVPMIHVWITPHPCGPFAALNGVGAGTVKAGQTHACDHVHGANGAAAL